MANSSPVKTFRVGHVSVSVFRNFVNTVPVGFFAYNTVVQNAFSDKDGIIQNNASFSGNDVEILSLLLEKAIAFISIDKEMEKIKDPK